MNESEKEDMEREREEKKKADGEGDASEKEPGEDEGKLPRDPAAKKSVAVDDLMKGLTDYEAVEAALTTAGGSDRESFLMARLTAGTITKSERQELGQFWAADKDTRVEPIQKSLTDSLGEGPNAEMMDASPFLKSLADQIGEALSLMRDAIGRDGQASHEMFKAQGTVLKGLGKVLIAQDETIERQGALIKALATRLGVIEKQPAVRKSLGKPDPRDVVAAPGRDAPGDGLSKSQIESGLMLLAVRADRDGNEPLSKAVAFETARLEQGLRPTPHLIPMIQEAVRQGA